MIKNASDAENTSLTMTGRIAIPADVLSTLAVLIHRYRHQRSEKIRHGGAGPAYGGAGTFIPLRPCRRP